jgi:hypothetical protein
MMTFSMPNRGSPLRGLAAGNTSIPAPADGAGLEARGQIVDVHHVAPGAVESGSVGFIMPMWSC